uniref:Uncharacterized protein n=1 Tax=Arundo donax TaxID=35708 RepID=A0A0A9AH27_ARUDO
MLTFSSHNTLTLELFRVAFS